MPVTVLVGTQWGDEGKGKIIDVLTEDTNMVIRFQGGNNAGHTVEIGTEKYVLHLVPSGIFRPDTDCVIGNGVVVDPLALMSEMQELAERNIDISKIQFSSKCHLIFPYHKEMDALREMRRSEEKKIGTTKRGIGPAYADKAARTGIRAHETLDLAHFEERFREQAQIYNDIFTASGMDGIDIDAEWEKQKEAAGYLAPHIMDTVITTNDAIKAGKNILFEGAQGAHLDIDHGTYPFVTSSNTTAGGATSGSGVSPKHIEMVYGVMKAYTTRVGAGPFPTELDNEEGEALRKAGNEFGATTGRPRRCGWFDAVATRYACLVNGIDKLAITKLDVLDNLAELKVCVAYEIDGKRVENMPCDVRELQRVVPVYETVEGWQQSTAEATCWEELPAKAQSYLKYIASLVDAAPGIISVGPRRDQTFTV